MVEFKKIISITETLKAIEVGKEQYFPQRPIKPGSIKAAAARLNRKKIYRFTCSEMGLPSGIKVTRLK